MQLCKALFLTFFYYTQLSNEIEDVLGLELVNMEKFDQMHRKKTFTKTNLNQKTIKNVLRTQTATP